MVLFRAENALLANVTGCPHCITTNPSPPWDASPWHSVGSLTLKYFSTGALTTASLMLSKATSCSWPQIHSAPLCVKRRSGSHISERSCRNFDRNLTSPMNLCTAGTSFGRSILIIASTLRGSVFSPSFVMTWPMKDTSLHLN